ncbi:esterase FE4-like isoform X2 [Leptidea sinapis]|nr:esterase FE4-like isoform X2 [Leptidea sinapis]
MVRAGFLYVCLLLASGCSRVTGGGEDVQAPSVKTPAGWITGSWMTSRRGRAIQAYRGIRYAEPPTGDLRFRPPVLIRQYAEAVDATADGPACPQPDIRVEQREDCLRLNVYTAANNGSKGRPVVVYVHPGGFYSVTGRSEFAGPHYLLDHDLVLVTINYRLGSLGFLSMGNELAPGNNGFKDQVAALRWVRRNIASFGGDPELVTIAGYSAGAISVALHMVSPMSRGLFHRAVSMSGSPYCQVKIPQHQRHLAEKQARLLDCPTDPPAQLLHCLRTVPWQKFGDSLNGFRDYSIDPILIWLPVVEQDFGQERFLEQHPLDVIKMGKLYSVPYIVSQTRDEFFWEAFLVLNNSTYFNRLTSNWVEAAPIPFLLPEPSEHAANKLKKVYFNDKPLLNNSETARALGMLYGDSVIGFGAHRLANLMSQNSAEPVFYYEFDYIGNNSHYRDPVSHKPVGVAHHDELIYLFSLSIAFPDIGVSSSPDSVMVDKLTSIMYNFALTG